VLAVLFVRALGGAFHVPAMTASTSLMVPEHRLTQIQGLNQSAQGLLLIVGAPLGGLLYALLPMAGLMLVDVGTALVAIVPLLFIHVPQPPATAVAKEKTTSVREEMLDGFRYLRRRTGHLTLVLLSAAVNKVRQDRNFAASMLPRIPSADLPSTAKTNSTHSSKRPPENRVIEIAQHLVEN
jgi:DHA3 family macrolide efflux protein-like MFS transporter